MYQYKSHILTTPILSSQNVLIQNLVGECLFKADDDQMYFLSSQEEHQSILYYQIIHRI